MSQYLAYMRMNDIFTCMRLAKIKIALEIILFQDF